MNPRENLQIRIIKQTGFEGEFALEINSFANLPSVQELQNHFEKRKRKED